MLLLLLLLLLLSIFSPFIVKKKIAMHRQWSTFGAFSTFAVQVRGLGSPCLFLSLTLTALPPDPGEVWEATVMNLGHSLRKLGQLAAAQEQYEAALSMSPSPGGHVYSALAFVLHLQGKLDAAIDNYHRALSVRPEDPFTTEMLTAAMDEALSLS